MTITIRPADERDIEVLSRLNRLVHELHLANAPAGFFKQPDAEETVALYRWRLERPDTRIWVACVDEVPAGHAVCVVRERQENALCAHRRWYELDEVVVAEEFRKQGVARALVEHVQAEARADGNCDVELNTWSFNTTAQKAFEALGFKPLTVKYLRPGG